MRLIQTGDLRPETPMSLDDREWVYNALDSMVALEVFNQIRPQLDNTTTATYEFSKALQAPIMEMTCRGILVDQVKRKEVLAKYKGQIDILDDQLTRIVRDGIGCHVENTREKGKMKYWWRSGPQLRTLLYDKMGLPVQRKKNAKGELAPTVDRDALEKLQLYFYGEPIVLHLLGLRDVDKKRSLLETEIDPDGRHRTSLNIAGTNTGRLASSFSDFGTGGNLQNIDRLLREVFIADPGMKMGNIDLAQADSRNLGALCWNTFYSERGEAFAGSYLNATESGDLHTTVSRMARPHLPWTDDPKRNRELADTKYHRNDSYRDLDKKLGHGTNFVGAAPTMAKHAHVPEGEVREFQRNYFAAFPCIPAYHEWVKGQLIDAGHLYNLFNRRRHFFGRPKDSSTLREAVAFGPQSSTAEEINLGMLDVWRTGKVQLLIQVHDSILFQFPEELEDQIMPEMLRHCKRVITLAGGREFFVPAEAKTGWNWGDFDKKNPDANPGGLKEWKGGDDRKRPKISTLSFM